MLANDRRSCPSRQASVSRCSPLTWQRGGKEDIWSDTFIDVSLLGWRRTVMHASGCPDSFENFFPLMFWQELDGPPFSNPGFSSLALAQIPDETYKILLWPMRVLRGQVSSYLEMPKVSQHLRRMLCSGLLHPSPPNICLLLPALSSWFKKPRKFEITKKLKMLLFFLGHLSLQ